VGYVAALDTTPHPASAMQRPPCRLAFFTVACVLSTFACQPTSTATLTDARRAAIADSLTTLIHSAYDLKAKDVVGRFMSLYPDTGRVISASGGRVTTTRGALESGIKSFWEYVGRNMQAP
jgi:hypothetical protein